MRNSMNVWMVTYRYLGVNEYIALLVNDQMMKIVFAVVEPPGNILELCIDASVKPPHINSYPHCPITCYRGGLLPSNIASTYHEGITCYAEADLMMQLQNLSSTAEAIWMSITIVRFDRPTTLQPRHQMIQPPMETVRWTGRRSIQTKFAKCFGRILHRSNESQTEEHQSYIDRTGNRGGRGIQPTRMLSHMWRHLHWSSKCVHIGRCYIRQPVDVVSHGVPTG